MDKFNYGRQYLVRDINLNPFGIDSIYLIEIVDVTEKCYQIIDYRTETKSWVLKSDYESNVELIEALKMKRL